MTMPLLHFQDLTLARGNETVLEAIDWTIRPGEHWLVTGANGAGKSTLAEAIAGRHRVLAGRRSWPGLRGERARAIRLISFTDSGHLFHNANAVHYYQQRFNAFDADGHLTVRDYLLANGHTVATATAALQRFNAEDLLDRERIKLSSGQTRKLLLAKALAGNPELLVIDNPYLGLDAASRTQLNGLLDELMAGGEASLVLVGEGNQLPVGITHGLHLAGGRIIEMEDIVRFMDKSELAPPKNGFMDKSESVSSQNGFTDKSELKSPPLQQIRQHFTTPLPIHPGEEIIRLKDVTVAYGDKTILKQLNWCVQAGEKWVVSGNNGSGKSTLLSLLYADHPQAYANEVYLFGRRRGRGESIWDVKRRIGFTSPELHTFFDGSLTARQVVLSGLNDTFRPPKTPTNDQLSFCGLLLKYAGFAGKEQRPFHQFSTGEQRLLLLLRALIKAPPVLLLDEPFQGFDEATIQRCHQLLAVAMTPERTLIFISHFREEVLAGVDLELVL